MSADFLSRVRAEALRRIEEERFEHAVIAEMRKIREEELVATQIPAYHKFHEERKVKLYEAQVAGCMTPSVAEIETAVSEYALGIITVDDVYAIIEAVDRDYPTKYVQSRQGHMIGRQNASIALSTPTRPGVPIGFQLYLELALGKQFLEAREKREKFNTASMAVVN
jgi:hypothetical protein